MKRYNAFGSLNLHKADLWNILEVLLLQGCNRKRD